MSAFRSVTQGFRNLWGQGGDDDYEDVAEEFEESPRSSRPSSLETHNDFSDSSARRQESRADIAPEMERSRETDRFPRYTTPPGLASQSPISSSSFSSESSSPSGARKSRPAAMPLRSRDKNIYTLKPKSMDEASLAADYLKTGCAVVLNLEEVERMVAVRIIDFMSGVCYGLEFQGHAMKLGETIFLFTPGDFEISSDEVDYGENRDPIFKDIAPEKPATPAPAPTPTNRMAEVGASALSPQMPVATVAERRSWER